MSDNDSAPIEVTIEYAFNHLLCHNGVVVTVNPGAAGVALPLHLRDQPRVVLTYELEPVVPIPDLEVTDEGVRATLSFERKPFATFVPWGAVLAMGPMHPARVETPPANRAKLKAV